MIAVIDYGVGNLFSLCRSLEAIGQEPVVTGDPALLRQADKLFLPGVGAFADAAAKLRQTGLDQVILEEAAKGKPLMGIWACSSSLTRAWSSASTRAWA